MHSELELITTDKQIPEPITDVEYSPSPLKIRFSTKSGLPVRYLWYSPRKVIEGLKVLSDSMKNGDLQDRETARSNFLLEVNDLMAKENLRLLHYLEGLLLREQKETNPSERMLERLEDRIAEFKVWCYLNCVEIETDQTHEPIRRENKSNSQHHQESMSEDNLKVVVDAYVHADIKARKYFKRLVEKFNDSKEPIPKSEFMGDERQTPKRFFSGPDRSVHRNTLWKFINSSPYMHGARNAAYYPVGFENRRFSQEISTAIKNTI